MQPIISTRRSFSILRSLKEDNDSYSRNASISENQESTSRSSSMDFLSTPESNFGVECFSSQKKSLSEMSPLFLPTGKFHFCLPVQSYVVSPPKAVETIDIYDWDTNKKIEWNDSRLQFLQCESPHAHSDFCHCEQCTLELQFVQAQYLQLRLMQLKEEQKAKDCRCVIC